MRDFYSSLVVLCAIYLFTSVVGLYTAANILPLMYPKDGGEPVIQPVVEDPESLESTGQFFVGIIIMTGLFLVLMKYRLHAVLRLMLFLSFFMGMLFSFTSFLGDWGMLPAMALAATILFNIRRRLLTTLTLMFALSGVSAMLGASLGFIPALVLVLAMSVYDIVAVFFTKHMVALAKGAQGKFPLMFEVPLRGRTLGLGAGDIALPLSFSVSILATYSVTHAVSTMLGGMAGLVWLFYYILDRKGLTLPALPPIITGSLIGFTTAHVILSF